MSEYWTASQGRANHTGHTCRECRGTIFRNEPIYVRDGRKIRLFYHRKCYSGDADPRTQASSSYTDKSWGIREKAPGHKGRGKWWTSEFGYRGHPVGAPPTLRNLASPLISEALRRPTSVFRKESSPSSACSQTAAMVDADTDWSEAMLEQPLVRRKIYNARPTITWP